MSAARSLVVSVLCALPLAVHAATLVPADGSVVPLAGSSVSGQPSLRGTIVEDVFSPFSFMLDVDGFGAGTLEVGMTGRVQSRVVRATDGTYDFYWRVLPDARAPYRGYDTWGTPVSGVFDGGQPITMFSVASFGSAGDFRAGWRSDEARGAAPTVAAAGPGAITFAFGNTMVNPGGPPVQLDHDSSFTNDGSSRFMFLDTDAHAYARGATVQVSALQDLQFGGFSAPITTFAPAAPVPEPATWALMLAGLGGVALASRRRQRQR